MNANLIAARNMAVTGRRAGSTANATPKHVPKKVDRQKEFAKKPAEARAMPICALWVRRFIAVQIAARAFGSTKRYSTGCRRMREIFTAASLSGS
jgi:hypothetical protein